VKPLFLSILFLLTGSNFLFAQSFNEILGRPTDSAITNSILFDQNSEVYWEYGTAPGVYNNTTANYIAAKDTTLMADFINLKPDTRYYYRTRYRINGTSTAFLTGSEHTFITQRATGSTYTFTIESDEHLYDKKGVRSIYKTCLANQAKDNPDFMLSLGDIFGDDHFPSQITSAKMKSFHLDYRQYLGSICHSIPLYICLGNHEGEKDYYLQRNPPDNMAVYATLWRKFYYPNPYPNNFYSGNTDVEGYGIGKPENYYAWTWGDALFVVLDVYRYDCDTSDKPKNWDWTLGLVQYNWLKNILETNKSKYKFVFAHHVSGEGRGGIEQAKLFEWGGYDQDGVTYNFAKNRPNMAKPIHKLFVDNGVNIFFQGHDHLFAHEVMDGVIYQEVPMPSDSTYEIGMLANAGAYVSDTIGGTGHLKVRVSPSGVKVDFIRAYLPADTVSGIHYNCEIAFSYTVKDTSSSIKNNQFESSSVKVYPNPAKDKFTIVFPEKTNQYQINLVNFLGQNLLQKQSYGQIEHIDVSNLTNGIYFLNIRSDKYEVNKKVIISR
jgi:hypothetical protein